MSSKQLTLVRKYAKTTAAPTATDAKRKRKATKKTATKKTTVKRTGAKRKTTKRK